MIWDGSDWLINQEHIGHLVFEKVMWDSIKIHPVLFSIIGNINEIKCIIEINLKYILMYI